MRKLKRILILSILAAALLFLFTGCAAAEFTGKEKDNAVCVSLDNLFTQQWVYIPSTLPASVKGPAINKDIRILPDNARDGVSPSEYSLEWISGDEHLKEALDLSESGEGDSRRVTLSVRDGALTSPGLAFFRIRLKHDQFYHELEFPFLVLSWKEDPLFDVLREDPGTIVLNKEVDYTDFELSSMLIRDHYPEILSRHPEMQTARNSWHLYQAEETPCLQHDSWGNNYGIGFDTWKFVENGSALFNFEYSFSNVSFYTDLKVEALPYSILSKGRFAPGSTVNFSISDSEAGSRTFVWQLKAEGLTLDEKSGEMKIPEAAKEGTPFTVTAVPSDGGTPAVFTGKVWSGALAAPVFGYLPPVAGFDLPVLKNPGMVSGSSGDSSFICFSKETADPYDFQLTYSIYPNNHFAENAATAEKDYDSLLEGFSWTVLEQKTVQADGHPARLILLDASSVSPEATGTIGMILYNRESERVICIVETLPKEGSNPEDTPPVNMGDLEMITGAIRFRSFSFLLSQKDGALELEAKDGAVALTAGKALQFTAVFANPDRVNAKAKNNAVTWTAVSAETGEAVPGITIDEKGKLSAAKDAAAPVEIRVKASSFIFDSEAEATVTVLPPVSSLTVDPSEIFFYTGTEKAEIVRPVFDPENVPPVGLTWTSAKAGVAEILPQEDGIVQIRPLAAGNTTVTVKEPGGKKATLKITVTEPVTGLELSVSGKPKAGGTVTVKAALEPKAAGNKQLEWSVDTDESVASVKDGKVKIAKDSAPGTVITVTCKALGAPEPVVQTIQIIVE